MRAFSLSESSRFTSGNNLKYEDYLMNKFNNSMLAYYQLGEVVSSTTAIDQSANAFNSVGVAGTTFGGTGISNTSKTACTFTGTTGASYIQLEASPGSRLRTSLFTLAIWFKRAGAGTAPTSGTGTGGITAEPLISKGMAESETATFNCNYFLGLEIIDTTNIYLSADFEKDNSGNTTNFPIGRNARMLDCSTASNVVTFLSHTQAGATAVPHTFNNGDRVRFGGNAITNITAAQWYYIVTTNKASGTFQISATNGGSAITIGNISAGGGAWFNHAAATTVITTSDTNWHFAVNTWDGTNLKCYLDGVLVENEIPTMIPPENTSTQLACISAGCTSAAVKSGGFNGKLQHATIWSKCLSASEIKDLYNKGIETPIAVALAPSAALLTATSIYSGNASTFVVQLTDAVSVDDTTVLGGSVVLKKDGSTLVQGTDYSFSYSNSLDQITLTATGIGSTFPAGSYQVILN